MSASFRPRSKPGNEPAGRRHNEGAFKNDPARKMDREAVAAGLRRYLDVILPATHFDLRYKIALPGFAPGAKADAAAAGNVDGNSLAARSGAGPIPLEAEFETPDVIVEFDGPDGEFLLERGAEVLKALEHLAVRSLRLEPQLHDRVRFDCGNYRADRIAELKLSAQVAAQRVRETRTPFRFNPMPARERRIIHLVLKDQPGVRTSSEGVGEDRHLVIYLAETK